MKRVYLIMVAVMLTMAAYAQFEAGKYYVGASVSGLSLSYNGSEKASFGLQAKGGYLFDDNLMATAQLGIDKKNDITSVDFEDLCASCEEDKKTSTIAAPDSFTDTFYYNEAGYDVSHTNRSLKITLTNKVGTKKTINVPYTFVLDSMDISGSSILDDEGKAVSSIPANTNRKHSVLVKAVSSHKIKSVRIVIEKEDGTLISYGPQYEVVDDAEKCKFDASTGLFNVNGITLNIPTDMGKNILMKNSYVEIVEDNYDASGNPIVKKIPLGTLLYDMSNLESKDFFR